MLPLAVGLALTTGFIAIRTGYVHRLFAQNHKSIQNNQINTKPRTNRWGPPLSEEQIRANQLSQRRNRFAKPLDENQILANLDRFGGKLTYNKNKTRKNKIRKNKTRKNKKRKTKKLKVKNKCHHTRCARTKRR